MKHLLLPVFICCYALSFCQDSIPKMKVFRVSISDANTRKSYGYLASMTDSTMLLVRKASSVRHPRVDEEYKSFHYNKITSITVTRHRSVEKGALIGSLAGLTLGVAAGFIEGDDPPCVPSQQDFLGLGNAFCEAFRWSAGDKALIYGTTGFASGALVGALVGAVAHKKFLIGKRKENFASMQSTLLERLYLQQK